MNRVERAALAVLMRTLPELREVKFLTSDVSWDTERSALVLRCCFCMYRVESIRNRSVSLVELFVEEVIHLKAKHPEEYGRLFDEEGDQKALLAGNNVRQLFGDVLATKEISS